MAEDKTYNGWTNWETWQVNLWFGDSFTTEDEMSPDAIESLVEEYLGDQEGMQGDINSAFIANVNWHELSETWGQE